jgi:hypothetical protein
MICLLRCFGKLIEKRVAEMLSDEAKRSALLSDRPCGNRKKRLAIEAVAIMVDSVHALWKEDNITGVPLMDMKAAFPSIARGRLINARTAMKLHGDLI